MPKNSSKNTPKLPVNNGTSSVAYTPPLQSTSGPEREPTSIGTYEVGGHLILWDLGLALQFPPGSTVLLPSASIAHSNVPVADDETRTSFTQYTAGGLLRWVDCGGCSLEELRKADKEAYQANRDALQSGKLLQEGIARLSTMEKLLNCGTVKWADSVQW
ncbi:hypothetical protein PQX77_008082 [Marasmius sp. AFHP31]|nr:hypothetical protein PQX77_008082 [Marasmius sp. AFHP31]